MRAFCLAFSLIFLTSCGYSPKEPGSSEADVIGPLWVLEDLQGRGVIDRLQTNFQIDEKYRVSGHAGCNRFMGSVSLTAGELEFSPLAATRKMCPAAIMDQENRFFETVNKVTGFRIEQGLLFLQDKGDVDVMRFAPQS